MNTTTESQKKFDDGRKIARILGGAVYVGVVIAATTLFISFVLTAFPEDAYFSRFIMTVAGILVGGSMIAFPVALHNWAVKGKHRSVTMGLYYGEMAIIAVNTIVSFSSLMAKYNGVPAPEWVVLYEPFSILAIVYTLVAWGTVFLMDPEAESKQKELKAQQDFNDRVSDKLVEYVDSIEGRTQIQKVAEGRIAQMFDASKLVQTPKSFTGHAQYNADTEEVRTNGRVKNP